MEHSTHVPEPLAPRRNAFQFGSAPVQEHALSAPEMAFAYIREKPWLARSEQGIASYSDALEEGRPTPKQKLWNVRLCAVRIRTAIEIR